jgi:hypothetical protein
MSNDDLRALGELPRTSEEERAAKALGRKARDAYMHAAKGHALSDRARRTAMPIVLAGIVGVYLTWAVSAAMSVGM